MEIRCKHKGQAEIAVAAVVFNIGALITRIGFRGPLLYYSYNKEPPRIALACISEPLFGRKWETLIKISYFSRSLNKGLCNRNPSERKPNTSTHAPSPKSELQELTLQTFLPYLTKLRLNSAYRMLKDSQGLSTGTELVTT